MSRLLKIFIVPLFLTFLLMLFTASLQPIFAQTCSSTAIRPENPQLDQWIAEAQQEGGAANLVPANLLKAIYSIEATTAYANPSNYSCRPITPNSSALGLMQILNGTYNLVVLPNEILADEELCSSTDCGLSRCNPIDAIEIAARVLLYKVNLWDAATFKPLGKILEGNKNQYYNAACGYYGSFNKDALTNQLAGRLGPQFRTSDNTLTYCEYVCAYTGLCSSAADFPQPRQYQYPLPLPISVDFHSSACDLNLSPSKTNPLRPNPFDLVKEEKNRRISDPNLALYCAQRPTVVKPPLSRPLDLIQGTLYSSFSQFTAPLLSLSGDQAQTDESRRFLADYLEGRAYYETIPEPQNPDFFQQVDIFFRSGVFRKLAPASYQDQLKNAIIQRASGRANTTVINRIYGFPTATTQVHDYELNTPYGKFKLSQLAPKPLNDPQALKTWQNTPTAKIWSYVPMFTREDTKGFVQAVDEPGQYSSQAIEVIHPHLARTYEVSSALSGLLTPLFPPQNPDLAENFFTPAPWDLDSEKPWWLESDQNTANQWNQSAPVCEPQTVVYGPGDLAKGGAISTSVYKSTLLPPVQDIRYSPTYLITHTPFLEQIAANLITGPHAVFSALSPLAKPVTEDWPAAADYNEKNPQYSFSAGRAEAGYKKSGSLGQFFYKYLGSIICQEEKTLAWLQPFFLGQSPSSSLCKTTPAGSGTGTGTGPGPGSVILASGSCPLVGENVYLLCSSFNGDPTDSSGCHGSNLYWQSNGLCTDSWCQNFPSQYCCTHHYQCRWQIPVLEGPQCYTNTYPDSVCYDPASTCKPGAYGLAADFAYSGNLCDTDAPVVLPEINGQQLNWELKTTYELNCGGCAGGKLIANDGTNVYEIHIYHLNEGIASGGISGQQVGTLYCFPANVGHPHVHIELRINGEMVKPDNLCQ